MAKEWTSIRIQKKTHEALSAMRLLLEDTQREGRAEYPTNRDDLISLDTVVEMLINHYWRKRGRSKSRAREAARQLLAQWQGGELLADDEEDE